MLPALRSLRARDFKPRHAERLIHPEETLPSIQITASSQNVSQESGTTFTRPVAKSADISSRQEKSAESSSSTILQTKTHSPGHHAERKRGRAFYVAPLTQEEVFTLEQSYCTILQALCGFKFTRALIRFQRKPVGALAVTLTWLIVGIAIIEFQLSGKVRLFAVDFTQLLDTNASDSLQTFASTMPVVVVYLSIAFTLLVSLSVLNLALAKRLLREPYAILALVESTGFCVGYAASFCYTPDVVCVSLSLWLIIVLGLFYDAMPLKARSSVRWKALIFFLVVAFVVGCLLLNVTPNLCTSSVQNLRKAIQKYQHGSSSGSTAGANCEGDTESDISMTPAETLEDTSLGEKLLQISLIDLTLGRSSSVLIVYVRLIYAWFSNGVGQCCLVRCPLVSGFTNSVETNDEVEPDVNMQTTGQSHMTSSSPSKPTGVGPKRCVSLNIVHLADEPTVSSFDKTVPDSGPSRPGSTRERKFWRNPRARSLPTLFVAGRQPEEVSEVAETTVNAPIVLSGPRVADVLNMKDAPPTSEVLRLTEQATSTLTAPSVVATNEAANTTSVIERGVDQENARTQSKKTLRSITAPKLASVGSLMDGTALKTISIKDYNKNADFQSRDYVRGSTFSDVPLLAVARQGSIYRTRKKLVTRFQRMELTTKSSERFITVLLGKTRAHNYLNFRHRWGSMLDTVTVIVLALHIVLVIPFTLGGRQVKDAIWFFNLIAAAMIIENYICHCNAKMLRLAFGLFNFWFINFKAILFLIALAGATCWRANDSAFYMGYIGGVFATVFLDAMPHIVRKRTGLLSYPVLFQGVYLMIAMIYFSLDSTECVDTRVALFTLSTPATSASSCSTSSSSSATEADILWSKLQQISFSWKELLLSNGFTYIFLCSLQVIAKGWYGNRLTIIAAPVILVEESIIPEPEGSQTAPKKSNASLSRPQQAMNRSQTDLDLRQPQMSMDERKRPHKEATVDTDNPRKDDKGRRK